MATASYELVGIGLYSVSEAARLLRIRGQRLSHWVRGYTHRREGHDRRSPPVIARELGSVTDGEILTFLDLMELRFVDWFRQEGVSLAVIRAAAREAEKLFQTDHPFAVKRFRTDGKGIFAALADAASPPEALSARELLEELSKAQMVFGDMVEPFLRNEADIDEKEISRWWPLGKGKRVVIDPRRAFGKPIDGPTGVPTFTLYQASKSGEDWDAVADWYEVGVEAVRDAVEYERWLESA